MVPTRTPSLPTVSMASLNASSPMKIAIVNPIPPAAPTTYMPAHVTPWGSMHKPSRMEIQLKPTIPSGFPTTNPRATPRNTASEVVSPS